MHASVSCITAVVLRCYDAMVPHSGRLWLAPWQQAMQHGPKPATRVSLTPVVAEQLNGAPTCEPCLFRLCLLV